MKKAFFIVAVVILIFSYDSIEAMFFSESSMESNSDVQACKIDFSIDDDSTQKREVGFDELFVENQEALVGIDFDVKNDSNCDIFIRVAILPVIVDKNATEYAYKLKNSSCEIQYLNDNSDILNSTYWEKSNDGYYYYKKIMKEGDSLENKLISGIKLNLTKGEMIELNDKQFKVLVRVESKQSKYSSYSNMW